MGEAVLPRGREVLLFAAKFTAVFALLIVPWRWLGDAYSLAFSMGSTIALETVVDERQFKIRFEPTAEPWGVRFLGTEVASGKVTELPIEARDIGYVPAAVLVALVVAAPLGARRRRTVLLCGMAAVGARVVLAVGLPVAHYVGTVADGSLLDRLVRTIFYALIEPPDMAYATPVVAFLLAVAVSAREDVSRRRDYTPYR